MPRFQDVVCIAICTIIYSNQLDIPLQEALKSMSIPTKVQKLLESSEGKIFSITFVKRSTGEKRKMVCRTGVSKDTKGVGLAFDPKSYNLLTVYDMQKKGYRSIPMDSVLTVTIDGKTTKLHKKRI